MNINLFGGYAKPVREWITVPMSDGDHLACSVCGTCLEPAGSSEAMYPGSEEGLVIREIVEMYKLPKYCPNCKTRMSNWRFMDLGS